MDPHDRQTEEETIRQAVLDHYHAGHAQHDFHFYEGILHPQWRFLLYNEEEGLRTIDREMYYSWYDPAGANPALEWETEFYSVDVTGNVAAVKLRLECQEVQYIDYFHMMKIDGKWWIVHKISHGVPKGE